MTHPVLSISTLLIATAITAGEDVNACWRSLDELDQVGSHNAPAQERDEMVLLQIQAAVIGGPSPRSSTGHHSQALMLETTTNRSDIDHAADRHHIASSSDNSSDSTHMIQGTVSELTDPSSLQAGLDMAAEIVSSIEDAAKNGDDGDPLKKVLDIGHDIVNKVKSTAGKVAGAPGQIVGGINSAGNAYDKFKKLTTNKKLGGHSKGQINAILFGMVFFVSATCLIVYAIEKSYPRIYNALGYSGPANKRPALWVLCLLSQAYLLLIPGLSEVLFSFKVDITVFGFHLLITSTPDGTPTPLTESTIEVIKLLYDTGGTLAAVLVTFYAIVIPIVKIVALGLGEFLRDSSNAADVQRSRWCILFVQYISKWACPDMFAYLLLLYLLRHLPEKSAGLIEAPAKLDVGFSCFAIFCVLSTLSSLAIEPPQKAVDPSAGNRARGRYFSPNGLFQLTLVLVTVFAVLLGIGLGLPCMGLEVDKNALLAPHGPIPRFFAPLLGPVHISSMVNSHVPIWSAIQAMGKYAWTYGEGNCFLGLIMLAVFGVVFPCIDMILLAIAAYQLSQNHGTPITAMGYAKVAGKISMLDVLCMGVIVVTIAAEMYKRMGVNVFLVSGIWMLIAAELVHWFTYWIVQDAVEEAEEINAAGGPKINDVDAFLTQEGGENAPETSNEARSL